MSRAHPLPREGSRHLDELVDNILKELGEQARGGFLRDLAREQIKLEIEQLREFAKTERPPNEVAEQIKLISKLVAAVAARIDKLPPSWRAEVRWRMGGAAFDRLGTQPSELDGVLERIRRALDDTRQQPIPEFHVKLQDKCAASARHLMQSLAADFKQTTGHNSRFYLIASLLFETVTGKAGVSMKKACDKNVRAFRDLKPATRSLFEHLSRQKYFFEP
jgi:hypothetical protein